MIKKNILEDIKPISRKGTGTPTGGFPPQQSSAPVSIQVNSSEPTTTPASFMQSAPAPREVTSSPAYTPPTPSYVPPQRPIAPRQVAFEPEEPKRSSRYGLWYIAVACVVGFLFSLSFLFEHATITATPKSSTVAFDATDTFTAKKDSTDEDTIIYTQMSLTGDESMKLPSTSTKTESVSATGTVVIYNTYSTAPQKLVKGTRLATSAGKIYKIDTAVTIPGYKKSGTTVTPGSVTVTVTAAVAGDASNIDASDFTVPGFAGSPQATKIYARTKTAISGGLSGTIYSVSQDAANAALGTLQTKLKSSLIAKAKVQVPDGYLYYDGATVFTTDDSVKAPYSKTQDVPLALHGTLTAYLIKEDTLTKAIAEKFVSQYGGEPVTIPKISGLTLAPSGALMPSSDTTFTFSLSGSASIVWKIDPAALKSAFVSRKKADFQGVLAGEKAVDKAEVTIKPFWKRSFPADINRITVNITEPVQ